MAKFHKCDNSHCFKICSPYILLFVERKSYLPDLNNQWCAFWQCKNQISKKKLKCKKICLKCYFYLCFGQKRHNFRCVTFSHRFRISSLYILIFVQRKYALSHKAIFRCAFWRYKNKISSINLRSIKSWLKSIFPPFLW